MFKEIDQYIVYRQHAGLQVRFLIGLIRKVTGVTIAAFFGDGSCSTYSGSKIAMPWHNSGGFAHNFRKYRMRLASLLMIFSVFVVHETARLVHLCFLQQYVLLQVHACVGCFVQLCSPKARCLLS